MTDVTEILEQLELGKSIRTSELYPIVFDELRRLAEFRIAREKPGQTLQATALVNEVYVRLVDVKKAQKWKSRSHFFAAAAEAMRRILVERARSKMRLKRAGDRKRQNVEMTEISSRTGSEKVLDIHEALTDFESVNGEAALLVKLRFFAGYTIPESAEIMEISPRKANDLWAFARAWLLVELGEFPC